MSKILGHKYYSDIKRMCEDDIASNEIRNWVKNTVDVDDTIPTDRKMNFYLSARDITSFKESLKATGAEIVVKNLSNNKVVSVSDSTLVKNLVHEDAERRIINLNLTYISLFKKAQERVERLISLLETDHLDEQQKMLYESIIQKYLTELRNLGKDYAKVTGLEDYYRKLGSQAAASSSSSSSVKLPPAVQNSLKAWARKILGKVSPEDIPKFIKEFEEIMNEDHTQKEKG